MSQEAIEHLKQLRRQLHELYLDPEENEAEIDRVAEKIRKIQEETQIAEDLEADKRNELTREAQE